MFSAIGAGALLGGGLLAQFGPRDEAELDVVANRFRGGPQLREQELLDLLVGSGGDDLGLVGFDVAQGRVLHERVGGPARDTLAANMGGFIDEDPFALSDATEGLFDARFNALRDLLRGERDINREDLTRRLSGRFGPGFESTHPFLEGEERFVNRPFFNALSGLISDDQLRRLAAGEFSSKRRLSGLSALSNLALLSPQISSKLGTGSTLAALGGSGLNPAKLRAGAPTVLPIPQPSPGTQFGVGALSSIGQFGLTGGGGGFG